MKIILVVLSLVSQEVESVRCENAKSDAGHLAEVALSHALFLDNHRVGWARVEPKASLYSKEYSAPSRAQPTLYGLCLRACMWKGLRGFVRGFW